MKENIMINTIEEKVCSIEKLLTITLKNLIQELETLNENLSDLKTMLAPWLGFKISEKELGKDKK